METQRKAEKGKLLRAHICGAQTTSSEAVATTTGPSTAAMLASSNPQSETITRRLQLPVVATAFVSERKAEKHTIGP